MKTIRNAALGALVATVAGFAGATEYFVDSQGGDDARDGLSAATAWRSLGKVNAAPLVGGDVVRFRRGGLWRGILVPHSGEEGRPVTYTTYGTGVKPILQRSVDRSRPEDWYEEAPGLWSTKKGRSDKAAAIPEDVGIFIVNHGERWGVKKWNTADWAEATDARRRRALWLEDELDYWYDPEERRVVVKYPENPGKAFDSIELAMTGHVVNETGKHDVVYDGLWVRYGAAHGFGGGSVANIVIRNCDICWIGGGLQYWKKHEKTGKRLYPVRYGNGIEFWNDCRNCLIERCRLWEIYDAAVTNQGRDSRETDVIWRDNVIWNSEYSYEYWNAGVTRNVLFEHNTCVDAGYGWAHAQRPDPNGAHLMYYANRADTANFVVRDNIFCRATEWTCRSGRDWRSGLLHDRNLVYNEGEVPVLRWLEGKRRRLCSWAEYVELGFDRNGRFAKPLFRNPATRDYRLLPNSPGVAMASDGTAVGARNMPGLDEDQSVSAAPGAPVVLTDFESPGDHLVKVKADGSQGVAFVTNACALSGERALWMGPHADTKPKEDFGFAEVYWTDPAKRDWTGADRFVFDVANLSHEERTLVFYLYGPACRKLKGARFSYPVAAGAVRRITVPLNWKKITLDPTDVRGVAFVHCAPKYGALMLDSLMLLRPGEVAPPECAPTQLKREAKAYAAYEARLEAVDLAREDEQERLRQVAFRKQLAVERPVQVARLRQVVADLRASGRETGRMVVFQASSMRQIRPRGTDFSTLVPATGLSLRLARGEYEGAQLAVASGDSQPLSEVSAEVTGDFDGRLDVWAEPLGFVLADAPLKHRLAACVPCATNACGYLRTCRETPLGWYADPILPYLKTVSVEPGDVQSFYVRVKARETCAPGTYVGAVRIRAKGVAARVVPLTVRVHAFEVGKASALPLLVTFTPFVQPLSLSWTQEQAEAVRRDPNAPVNLWRRRRTEWSDFLGEYFLLPSTIYPSRGDAIPDFDLIKRAFSRGRRGPFIVAPWEMCRDEASWRKTYLEPLKKRYAAACAAGLGAYAMTYGCDEITPDRFDAVARALDILKKEAPEVPVITTSVDPDLGVGSPLEKVDVFCPLSTDWNQAKVAASRAAGHRVWWYVACGEVPPMANFFVESPLSEGRLLMGAQAFREKPDGFLYYAIAKWNTRKALTGGPFTDWSPHGIRHRNQKACDGDGVMTYCGPDGLPLATLRLENFRDGVEDYNYAAKLESLYKAHADKTEAWAREARALLDIPLSVMESLRNFTDDPAAIYAWRNRMADLIEYAIIHP